MAYTVYRWLIAHLSMQRRRWTWIFLWYTATCSVTDVKKNTIVTVFSREDSNCVGRNGVWFDRVWQAVMKSPEKERVCAHERERERVRKRERKRERERERATENARERQNIPSWLSSVTYDTTTRDRQWWKTKVIVTATACCSTILWLLWILCLIQWHCILVYT